MSKYQHFSIFADLLHLWYELWIPTATFSINFGETSDLLEINFPKM